MNTSTIPQVRRATRAAGSVTRIRRIVLSESDAGQLTAVTKLLQRELAVSGAQVPVVVDPGPLVPGDLCLSLTDEPAGDHESYSLQTSEAVTVQANHPAGIYYGTRTVRQLLRGDGVNADIGDAPDYRQRGVMVDVGRKYFSPAWLREFIRQMGWLKLNTLHLHLNDNNGVGLECRTHPEIVSTPALDRQGLCSILDVAATHHVTVIPEFDTPAHARAILDSHPEFALHDRNQTVHDDKIDFSIPGARNLVWDVLTEWADLFGSEWFHLGGDEFFAAPWEPALCQDPGLFPTLAAYASQRLGRTASARDAYTLYLNELGALLRSRGKNVKVWNDHVDPHSGIVGLDASTQVDVWIRWDETYPSATDFANAGHSIINRHGDYLYFIVSADQEPVQGDKSPRGIYERWHPNRFMGVAGRTEGDLQAPAEGAILSIWCDDPDAMTETELFEDVADWLRSFSQRVWGTPSARTYREFSELFRNVHLG